MPAGDWRGWDFDAGAFGVQQPNLFWLDLATDLWSSATSLYRKVDVGRSRSLESLQRPLSIDIMSTSPLLLASDSSTHSQPEPVTMDPTIACFRPRSEADWEKWRPVFTRLYIEESRPLPQVMEIMEDQHRLRATERMYKTKIKAWNLRKYLKDYEAQQIIDGEIPASETAHAPAVAREPEKAVKRAARALKRKRARERAQNQPSPTALEPEEVLKRAARALKRKRARERAQNQPSPTALESFVSKSFPSQTSDAMLPCKLPWDVLAAPQGFRVNGVAEQFLFNLRAWTHDAFVFGHWDTKLSAQHHSGRQASRLLSSNLTAGTNLYEIGKQQLAWTYWSRAVANFHSPDLFKTWYHETPIRLLFEVGRVAHSGHGQLAAILLKSIKSWAHAFLEEDDSRHALFSVFGELDVAQLRDLYVRAAHCLYNGLDSRIDKHSPLLYEVRLNRALDMLWYDPDSDLTEWLPPIEEVDQACAPNNPYSVYFLLLQAYRLVAQESYPEADQVCSQVRTRLAAMEEGSIDSWRVGLAYRRLGRQQHSKGRYTDARRSFNTALKHVGSGNRLSASILIEICQRQESMANAFDDQEDAELWNHMLRQLEQQTKYQDEVDMSPHPRLFAPPAKRSLSARKDAFGQALVDQ